MKGYTIAPSGQAVARASANAVSRPRSSRPSSRSPEHTSKPWGRTACTAAAAFSGRRPPASHTGTGEASLHFFKQLGKTFRLETGVYIDRESIAPPENEL